jgi:hypothetical protein
MAKYNEKFDTKMGVFYARRPHVEGQCVGCVAAHDDELCDALPDCTGVIFEAAPATDTLMEAIIAIKGAGKPKLASEVLAKFHKACAAVAECSIFGAQKYGVPPMDSSFKALPNAEVAYCDAAVRHITAYLSGQPLDSESGKPHLAHAAWSVLAALEVHLEK